jgi:uncharacterized protein
MKATAAIHESHPGIVRRLRRVEGHLRSVIGMIENGRSCVDLAQQLHAVEKAVGEAKRTLVRDHIDHCLEVAVGKPGKGARGALGEFKDITKYL